MAVAAAVAFALPPATARPPEEPSPALATDTAHEALLAAEAAEREGRLWDALAVYRDLAARSPGTPAIKGRLASLARAMGLLPVAECAARRVLAGAPRDGGLHYLLGAILADAGRTDEALSACRRALELDFDAAPLWVTLGNLHYQRMEIAQAIAALGRAVEQDPAAAERIASFALSSLTTSDHAAVRALLERHLAAHPASLNTLYALAVMNLREDRRAEAEALFERLARLAPGHAQVHYNLAQLHLRAGRDHEARAAMERFRELKAREDAQWLQDNRQAARRLQAQEALDRGNFERAIALHSELAAEVPPEPGDLVALGHALLAAGRFGEAFDGLQRALETTPADRAALEGLATAAEALGRSDAAAATREHLRLGWGDPACPQ